MKCGSVFLSIDRLVELNPATWTPSHGMIIEFEKIGDDGESYILPAILAFFISEYFRFEEHLSVAFNVRAIEFQAKYICGANLAPALNLELFDPLFDACIKAARWAVDDFGSGLEPSPKSRFNTLEPHIKIGTMLEHLQVNLAKLWFCVFKSMVPFFAKKYT